MSATHTIVLRLRPRRPSPAAIRELVVFAMAYLVYFGVRAVTEGAPWKAFANATRVLRFEVVLGIDWEGAVQAVVVRSQALVDVANAVYIYGHWPILIGAGILLFRYRRRDYYRLRNACILTGLGGLIVFSLFPVAPPRLTDMPVIDTVTRDSEGYRQILPAGLVNQYAAMPSFHAGWNLLVGVVVFGATRNRLLRVFAVIMPVAMGLAVVATANHYVVDVFAGVAIVLAGMAIVRTWETRRGRRGAGRDHVLRHAGRPRHAARRRPQWRERSPALRGVGHRLDVPHHRGATRS